MFDRHHIRKILVIKLRAIGDVLLSTVVLHNLRAAYPDAKIHFLAEEPSRKILEGNPSLDAVLLSDPHHRSGLHLLRSVRSQRYDMVIDLFGNPRSALVTLFSGARHRVGYRFNWRQYCYTTRVTPRGGEVHNVEFNLDALRSIGVPIVDTSVSFTIDEPARLFADQFFREAGFTSQFVVALNPGGGWVTKRWRERHFAQVADMIAEEYSAEILLVWGPGERETADRISALMRRRSILMPPTDLKQLAAILRKCSAMVTNDSGPMHIAASNGVPIVAIFGPTNPDLQGPRGTHHVIAQNHHIVCLGCNYTYCPIGNPCMEELSPEDVFSSFKSLIPQKSPVALNLP